MRYGLVISLLALLIPIRAINAQDSMRKSLTIFAATSLTDVFEGLRDAFVEANPEAEILLNFSSSSTLAAQLVQGAPADIFASANEIQMDLVIESELIAEDAVEIFAHNQLVLITPAANPANIESVQDLSKEAVLLVLAAQGTPIRAYSDAMIASHSEVYGEDFYESVMRNLVSEESNVRQVVTRIALGEADAGIVYQSDAIGDVASQLHKIEIYPAHNQLASYPIAALSASADLSLTRSFIDFTLSDEAQPIFAEYGFCSPAILTDGPQAEVTPEPTIEAPNGADTPSPTCPTPATIDG